MLVVIKKLSRENQAEIRHSCDVLLKGIFEASEVLTPTTFIVLLKKLPEPPTEKVKAELLEISKDGSGVTVSGEHASVTFTAEGARFGLEGEHKETVAAMERRFFEEKARLQKEYAAQFGAILAQLFSRLSSTTGTSRCSPR